MSQDSFFEHPSIDKIMKVTMALARELYVTRDRLMALEVELERLGAVRREALDKFSVTPEALKEIRKSRDDFIATILEPIISDAAA